MPFYFASRFALLYLVMRDDPEGFLDLLEPGGRLHPTTLRSR